MADDTPMPLPQGDHILIADPDALRDKIDAMRNDGPERLQVIADFDMTLTRYKINGQRGLSCHRVLERSPLLGEDFQRRTQELHDKFYPMEIDPHLDHDTKEAAMIEWWTSAHSLLEKYGLERHHLAEMVQTEEIALREGVPEFLEACQKAEVPVHIFSAGLYDVIHAFMRDRGYEKYGAHVISNQMKWDKDGKFIGFQGELIHTLNKSGKAIKTSPTWSATKGCHNVILLGDNTGDIKMADGLDICNMITIGFLNDRVDDRKELYMKLYDIVILGDGDFAPVAEVFKLITP
eukprot:m.3585 g.3585  ORF g.3585 m.3585 type:complete len:292 (+) comp2324_c0_seq1:66-941(+)